MKVKDIYNVINVFAPFATAESYDNVGILAGNPDADVNRALIALDCTDEVVDEAVKLGANLVITHHPIIFNPLKNVLCDSIVYKIVASGLSVICAHTNLDMAHCGVNDALAKKLCLKKIVDFDITNTKNYNKLVTFVPEENSEEVRKALCEAGAGIVGNYSDCTFSHEGTGRFKPLYGSNPYLGEQGKIELVAETRIEVVFHPDLTSKVVSALKSSHPYETVAYDIFEDKGLSDILSIGRVGELENPMTARELAQFTKEKLGCKGVPFVDTGNQKIKTVAICAGSGGSLIELALKTGAQAYITSEIKHNIWLDAKRNNLALIDAGHYHTERVVLEPLCKILGAECTGVHFDISREEDTVVEFI